jgi:hypothetical protein
MISVLVHCGVENRKVGTDNVEATINRHTALNLCDILIH